MSAISDVNVPRTRGDRERLEDAQVVCIQARSEQAVGMRISVPTYVGRCVVKQSGVVSGQAGTLKAPIWSYTNAFVAGSWRYTGVLNHRCRVR